MTELYALNTQVAWRDLDGHIFAVTPDNRQHELSGGVEHTVWTSLDRKPRTLLELVAILTAEFDVEAAVAEADLRTFLTACIDAQLVDSQ